MSVKLVFKKKVWFKTTTQTLNIHVQYVAATIFKWQARGWKYEGFTTP